MPFNIKDKTGQRYGRLTVQSFSHIDKPDGIHSRAYWKCKCDCGNEVIVRGDYLSKNLKKRSCGCLYEEVDYSKCSRKHGMEGTPIYSRFYNMHQRCENPNDKSYHNYGGRGIKVCKEWESFEIFLQWATKMGYFENPHLTIDRIDVNKDYCPENCRLVDWKTQGNNRRTNKYLEYNGQKHTYAEWEHIMNLPKGIIRNRINRGWSIKDTLEKKPIQKRRF